MLIADADANLPRGWVILFWHADMQDSVRGLRICLGWIKFLREQMDGLYVWATIRFANISCAELDKDVKTGGVSINFFAEEFLLSGQPIIELEAMRAPTFLKNLVSALNDCRENDFLMLFIGALDCDYPVF
jgi:hypothetical protein